MYVQVSKKILVEFLRFSHNDGDLVVFLRVLRLEKSRPLRNASCAEVRSLKRFCSYGEGRKLVAGRLTVSVSRLTELSAELHSRR